jgi:hypothetical protein
MASVEFLDDPPNLEDTLRRLASRRAWLVRSLVLMLTVLIACAVVGQALWPNVVAFFHPATYDLYMTTNVNWGTVIITHGDQVTKRTLPASTTPFARLAQTSQPYRVNITVDTPPFTLKRCQLTIPPSSSDTCLSVNGASIQIADKGTPAFNVAFTFTFNDLPPGLRPDVRDLVTAQLRDARPQTTIAAGSHYGTGGALGKRIVVADQPITATLITTPANDVVCIDDCFPTEGDCRSNCTPSHARTLSREPDIWRLRVFVIQDWRFTRADGTSAGDTDENDVPHPLDLVLVYNSAQQHWELPPTDMGLPSTLMAIKAELCFDGQGYIEALFFQSTPSFTQFEPTPQAVDHQMAGCLFHVPATDPRHPSADFLWRFGQLYAANDIANQADSSIPVASPADLVAFAFQPSDK